MSMISPPIDGIQYIAIFMGGAQDTYSRLLEAVIIVIS